MNAEDKHVQTYLEEARELLAELEESVLELEGDMSNMELVNRIFRAMHTIKGSGAMFGFDAVADFTHHVETALDHVRNGAIPVTRELTGLILTARDQIASMIYGMNDPDSEGTENQAKIIAGLHSLLPEETKAGQKKQVTSITEAKPYGTEAERAYRIRFTPGRDILRYGNDPLALLGELEALGRLWVTAITDSIPVLEDMDYEVCYVAWDMALVSGADLNAIRDVFIFVEDTSEVIVEQIDNGTSGDSTGDKIGEILLARGDVVAEDMATALSRQANPKLGEILAESGAVSKEKVESALVEQQVLRQQAQKRASASIRVAAEKLDQLINLVGELVTTQAQLTQAAQAHADSALLSAVERVENLTNELRDCVMGVRMLPVGSTFATFRRLVRDLSVELGKEVDFITEGDDTELDKTMIEKISDPLVHIIRNSLDHGIETPEERESSGKLRRGTIRLKAGHAGGKVVISVEDDGRGIDTEKVARKAMEKGLIDSAKSLSESLLLNLIFLPGFSMARTVSDISGRGVGMDVVKREIEALRGTVNIRSAKGQGTAIQIGLPLTLAIIDGLLVDSGGEQYVIPLHHIQECLELMRREIDSVHGRCVINVRGKLIPYIRLSDFFSIPAKQSLALERVIVVQSEHYMAGLVVDRIIGERQTVIKSLGRSFGKTEGISGATVLGDGTVALILDVAQMMQCAHQEETRVLH
jgi:two-component system chemotaxis sensor kinase CheA